jgi:hypothetical protein
MESAEDMLRNVDSRIVNSFSTLFRDLDTLRDQLQSAIQTNEFDESETLVRQLSSIMDRTFQPLFAQSTTKRYAYSRQGIDRIEVSIEAIAATDRLFKRLTADIRETEEKLLQMGVIVTVASHRQPHRDEKEAPESGSRERQNGGRARQAPTSESERRRRRRVVREEDEAET